MGMVDLGEDPETGARVAIKHLTVSAGPLLDALRREVRVLAKIEHPSIVRIFEHDLWAETPWYAMEYVGNESLRSHLHGAPSRELTESAPTRVFEPATDPDGGFSTDTLTSESIPTALSPLDGPSEARVGRVPARSQWEPLLVGLLDICSALSALHARGVVHRDLKPENILYRPDGRPVIVDFGISMHSPGLVGRERLTRSMRASGTPAYLSPEQATHKPVDARSDLYSLGCLFFEVVTGQVPFADESVIRVLQSHAFMPAPSARSINPEIPVELDELITRLLQKQPQDRLGYAIDVDAQLRQILGLPPPGYEAPHYIYTPAFVGRDNEFLLLRELFSDVQNGKGRGLKILGEAGIGKTRLVHEVVQAFGNEIPVNFGYGDSNGNIPFGAFISAWRSVMADSPERAKTVMKTYGSWWKSLSTSRRPPGWEDVQTAYQLISDTIHNMPMMLVIDDAQWVDQWSALVLERLIASPPDGLGVIVLVRTGTPIASQIETTHVLELGRLSREDLAEVLCSITGVSRIGDVYVDYAMMHSDGNPFFLAELARMAMREGLLRRDAAGRWHAASDRVMTFAEKLKTPEPVESLFRAEFAALETDVKEALRLFSCIGTVIEPKLIRNLSDDQDLVDKLIQSNAMIWHDARLRFCHPLMAQVIYADIVEDEKRAFHERIADYLEAQDEPNPFDLARHLTSAGHVERASTYHRKASQMAMRIGLNTEAIRHFTTWIKTHPDLDDDFWTYAFEFLRNHYSMTISHFAEATEALANRARENGDPKTLAASISYFLRCSSELDDVGARKLILEAYDASRRSESHAAHLMVLQADRVFADRMEDHERTEELLMEVIRYAEEHGLNEGLIEGLVDLAVYETTKARFADALALLERAEQVLQPGMAARVHRELWIARAVLEGDLGRHELSLAYLEKLLAELRLNGDNRQCCVTLWNMANQYNNLERYEEAQATLQEVETITGYSPFHDLRALCATMQAVVEANLGEIQRATNYFLRAQSAFQLTPNLGSKYCAHFQLSHAGFLRRIGKNERASEVCPDFVGEPYVDSLIWAERGFQKLARGQAVGHEVEELTSLVQLTKFEELGEPVAALRHLRKASESDPSLLWQGELISKIPPLLYKAIQGLRVSSGIG